MLCPHCSWKCIKGRDHPVQSALKYPQGLFFSGSIPTQFHEWLVMYREGSQALLHSLPPAKA